MEVLSLEEYFIYDHEQSYHQLCTHPITNQWINAS